MNYDDALAVVMIASNGFIDKLELKTSLQKSDRDFLAAYQAKLAANKSTAPREDARVFDLAKQWAVMRHRITK